MKRLAIFAALALSACATNNKVVLTASKGFAIAQIGYNGAKQAAIACITNHVPVCVANKAKIISLNDHIQIYETQGFEASRALNMAGMASAASSIISSVLELEALGVKVGN